MAPTIRVVPIADLVLDDQNSNKHTERGKKMLEKSLRELGAGRSVLVDKHNRVIAGNATIETARAAGIKEIAVIETDGEVLVAVQRSDVDLSSPKGRRLSIADNRVSEVDLNWDGNMLRGLNVDLADYFNDSELRRLGVISESDDTTETAVDHAEGLQVKWGTAPGMTWEIGEHRLTCGDSRVAEDLARLFPEGTPGVEVLWTDPPYGVDYVGKTKSALRIQGDSKENLGAMLLETFQAVDRFMNLSCRFYIAAPAGPQGLAFRLAIAEAGWNFRQCLVWVKNSMVLGHSDYHYRHEDILYGDKPGPGRVGRGAHQGSKWYGGNSEDTVLSVNRPSASREHPTMKPIDLITRCLENSSHPNDVVLDAFCGSGSTLVACQNLKRRGRGIEIDPKYCAVALERLSMLGLMPRLAS